MIANVLYGPTETKWNVIASSVQDKGDPMRAACNGFAVPRSGTTAIPASSGSPADLARRVGECAELRNARPAGTRRVKKLPWPAPKNVNLIYWCRADLDIRAVVKGQRPAAGKEFLWGTAKPGCELHRDEENRAIMRVWFIREEGKYVPWDENPTRDPQQQFGDLLLTPAARSVNPKEFAQGFFAPASTNCFVLGRARCVERIRSLAGLGEPELQRAACDFLKSEFQVGCER